MNNIVVLAFSLFLVVISLKYGIMLPDNACDLKQGITKIGYSTKWKFFYKL